MWYSGKIIVDAEVFSYEVKAFDEPSQYGIDGGKISILEVALIDDKESKFIVAFYDREWVFTPKLEIAKKAVKEILLKYN